MANECTLSTGKLPLGGLPRNSVFRINDHPDMTTAVYCGHKVSNKIKQMPLWYSIILGEQDDTYHKVPNFWMQETLL